MAELTVDIIYGKALYMAAKEVDKVQLVRDEAKEVLSIIKGEPDFMAFINTPVIPAQDKKDVLEKVFGGKVCDELLNLLYVLVDKGRTRHIAKIFAVYEELIDESEGFAIGKIISVNPLKEEQLKKFEAETTKLLRKNVRLKNETDPGLIGGVRIFIDGKLIDASLRSRLDNLGNTII